MQSFVLASTDTVAHGMEAAGIHVSLPLHVDTMLNLLYQLSLTGLIEEHQIAEHVPFVYDCKSTITFGH